MHEWSSTMMPNRTSFNMFRMRPRKRQHHYRNAFHFNQFNSSHMAANGRQAILWELKEVDQRIQTLQMEIFILKRQIKIIRTTGMDNIQSPDQQTMAKQTEYQMSQSTYSIKFESFETKQPNE